MSFITRGLENIWIVQVLDKYMIGHNGFIAGGCFKNLFNKEKIKDIDIFFKNSIDFQKAVKFFEDDCDYVQYYKNNKVTAFKNTKTEMVVELVKSVFGTPEEIIKSFDFTITKIAYFKEDINPEDFDEVQQIEYKIIHHKDIFEHLFFKRLVIDAELKFPISSFERTLKYKGYGYGLCSESKKKLVEAIKNNTNPNDDINASLYDGLD